MRIATLLTVAVLAAACRIAGAGPAPQDRVVHVEAADKAMNAAIGHAQQTLPGFLALAAKPPAGTKNYKLKVAVSDPNGTEHFWIIPFEPTASGFRGVVGNTPMTVKNVKEGQVIEFDRMRISDWGYERDGRQVGSFTVCVLFKQMPQVEADRYRREFGFDC